MRSICIELGGNPRGCKDQISIVSGESSSGSHTTKVDQHGIAAFEEQTKLTKPRKKKISLKSRNGAGNRDRRERVRQDERKRLTREKIIAAGQKLSNEGNYSNCAVEDIAQSAGVSRAAFYLYFKDKEELLQELVNRYREWYISQYRVVSPSTLRSEQELLKWFDRFVRGFRESNELTLHSRHIKPVTAGHEVNQGIRRTIIETLGHRLPGLRLFRSDGSVDPEREAEILLFIYELEQLCVHIGFGVRFIPEEFALRALARHFMRLNSDGVSV